MVIGFFTSGSLPGPGFILLLHETNTAAKMNTNAFFMLTLNISIIAEKRTPNLNQMHAETGAGEEAEGETGHHKQGEHRVKFPAVAFPDPDKVQQEKRQGEYE